jgi:hypothetical protein
MRNATEKGTIKEIISYLKKKYFQKQLTQENQGKK